MKNMMSSLVLSLPDEPEIEFVPVVNQEMVIITPPEHPLKYKKKSRFRGSAGLSSHWL